MLRDREVCVCDLVDILHIQPSKAMWHLKYLLMARLISSRKEGKWAFYRLRPCQDDFHAKALDCLWESVSRMSDLAHDIDRWTERGPGRCG